MCNARKKVIYVYANISKNSTQSHLTINVKNLIRQTILKKKILLSHTHTIPNDHKCK